MEKSTEEQLLQGQHTIKLPGGANVPASGSTIVYAAGAFVRIFIAGVVRRTVSTLNVVVDGTSIGARSRSNQIASLNDRHLTHGSLYEDITNTVVVPVRVAVAAISHRIRIFPFLAWVLRAVDGQNVRVVKHEVVACGMTGLRCNQEGKEEEGVEKTNHDIFPERAIRLVTKGVQQ